MFTGGLLHSVQYNKFPVYSKESLKRRIFNKTVTQFEAFTKNLKIASFR